MMGISKRADFESLVGETLTEITGFNDGSEEIIFRTVAKEYTMCHQQDCCESVSLIDATGDVKDLLDVPILLAREETSGKQQSDMTCSDSFTWTFYRLGTIKGTVVLRWLGESNGYYSEDVGFSVSERSEP